MINKIITDISAFDERTDEITGATSFREIKNTIADLKKVLNSKKDAVAICAPQIGINSRLFIVKTAGEKILGDSRYKVFLNPMIISQKKEKHLSRETNLSFPDKQFIIFRSNEIHVAYQEADGRPNSETFVGAYAEVVSQMIEMLDGVTLADYGLDLDDIGGPDAFDQASDKDKIAVIDLYIKDLQNKNILAQEDIKNNSTLNELDKTIRFMSEVFQGNIKPIDADGNEVDLFTTPKQEKEN